MSEDVRIKFGADQLDALDQYLDALAQRTGHQQTRSQFIRDAVGLALRHDGQPWPDDPQRGGDRRSPAVR